MVCKRWVKKITIVTICLGVTYSNVGYTKEYRDVKIYLSKECKKKRLNYKVMKALAMTESGLNPKASSIVYVGKKKRKRAHCRGVFQILDSTAKKVCKVKNVNSLYNYQVNIKCGLKYFDSLLKKYRKYDHAILAFNAGYYDSSRVPFNIKYLNRVKARIN